jgi:hypothetical protein
VHQSHTGDDTLWYRVGQFTNPSGGNYRIRWTSGDYGIRYAGGRKPHIALNNNNYIVATNWVSPNLLESRPAAVGNGVILWGASYRFPDSGYFGSSLALTQTGVAISTYVKADRLWQRFGQYSGSSTSPRMNWADTEARITDVNIWNPALATTGKIAVEVHEQHENGKYKLYYSTIQLPNP